MPLASGRASIAICDRCNFKYPYMALRADGNSPGLRVCQDCWDPIDPWRLPPIQPDAIALRFPRPDTPLTFDPLPIGASVVPVNAYVSESGVPYATEDSASYYVTES